MLQINQVLLKVWNSLTSYVLLFPWQRLLQHKASLVAHLGRVYHPHCPGALLPVLLSVFNAGSDVSSNIKVLVSCYVRLTQDHAATCSGCLLTSVICLGEADSYVTAARVNTLTHTQTELICLYMFTKEKKQCICYVFDKLLVNKSKK